MQRVVKRFLLHNSREDDEAKESDFDEFKQDVQIARIEMLSDLKRSRESTLKYIMILHTGISMIGDLAFSTFYFDKSDEKDEHSINSNNTEENILTEFNNFKQHDQMLKDEMQLSLQTTALALRNQGFFFNNIQTTTTNITDQQQSTNRLEPSHQSDMSANQANLLNEIPGVNLDDNIKNPKNFITLSDLNVIAEEN